MKKRILFVEDEPSLLDLYVMMLADEGDAWDVATAGSAEEALDLMKQSAFDVVVSDLEMYGMNGIELLTRVRTQYPLTSRIMLSGIKDQQEVARCLGSTHQFLAKPFDVGELKATLHRVGGLDAYLHNPKLQALMGQLGSLPSFPSLYLEIMKELEAENSTIGNIAAIISKDPGMTAKILQIVNSAAIGLARQVSSPFEAVEFLGVGIVRSLVLSAHIFSCFERTPLKGFSIDQLWNHSMRTGMIARRIMQLEQAPPAIGEDAYTAGVLHDVGKLMLANSLADQYQQALSLADERNLPLSDAEQDVFGATHAGAAAYLLGLWGLPATIVEAIAFHHTPGRSDVKSFGPLTAVHVADVLEQELSKAKPIGKGTELNAEYLAAVGVQNRVDTWRTEAAKLIHSRNGD